MTRTSTLVRAADDHPIVAIVADGHKVATAEVRESGAAVRVSFSVSHGHLPMRVRRELVDAVFQLPLMQHSRTVLASVPLGDVDLLNGLRAHCVAVSTRAAGSTCLVDGTLEPPTRTNVPRG
jgi:hypothetical protein